MKTSFRVGIVAVVALTALFVLGGLAVACQSAAGTSAGATDREYKIIFHPGITWAEAAREVASWGGSYQLAAITSEEEQKSVASLLGGINGEFWVGGYQDSSNNWKWASGETWAYTDWAKGQPNKTSNTTQAGTESYDWVHGRGHRFGWVNIQSTSVSSGNYVALRSGSGKSQWAWYDEGNTKNITGFVIEKVTGPVTPIPLPPAALFLGSGITMIGFLGLRGRSKRPE